MVLWASTSVEAAADDDIPDEDHEADDDSPDEYRFYRLAAKPDLHLSEARSTLYDIIIIIIIIIITNWR